MFGSNCIRRNTVSICHKTTGVSLQRSKRLSVVYTCGILLTGTAAAFAEAPTKPSLLIAVPNYKASPEIDLEWKDNSNNEDGFEIERKVDAGAFALLHKTAANITKYTDTDVADGKEYEYRVLAFKGADKSDFTTPVKQNVKTTWPVSSSHEILHTWNDPLGEAAPDTVKSGFHSGVDIQRPAGANGKIQAPRGGKVVSISDSNKKDQQVIVRVNVDGSNHDYLFAHLNAVSVAKDAIVHSGQEIGVISDTHFPTPMTHHTHYEITKNLTGSFDVHPLSIYTANADKDPQSNKPGLKDHDGSAKTIDLNFDPAKDKHPNGLARFRNHDKEEKDEYRKYAVDDKGIHTYPLQGGIDIIVFVTDQMGTNPVQAPGKVGYWISKKEADVDGCVKFHGVRSEASPYLLIDKITKALHHDDPALNNFALMRQVVDIQQNLGSNDTALSITGQKVIKEKVGMTTHTYQWPNYKHFILTNTKGTDGTKENVKKDEHWNTTAKNDDEPVTVAHANYAGKPSTTKAKEARFPDGIYTVHVLAADLVNGLEEVAKFDVRLENFCPVACVTEPTGMFPPGIKTKDGKVVFSEVMDTSVDAKTVVKVDSGAKITNAAWSADKRSITFKIEDIKDGKTYKVTVRAENARDQRSLGQDEKSIQKKLDGNGDGTCGDDLTYEFTTEPLPAHDACPGEGACCTAHDGPGCENEECCNIVCGIHEECCTGNWTAVCAALALQNCDPCAPEPGDPCGAADGGDCCTPHETPGCDDAECCYAVCTIDPFCCEVEWDNLCAFQAVLEPECDCTAPALCPEEASGNCCEAGDQPGCGDASCCEAVCLADAFCCIVEWDSLCADQAQATPRCGCPAPPHPCIDGTGDCCSEQEGPGCGESACCELVCGFDPFCCAFTWDGACAELASLLAPTCSCATMPGCPPAVIVASLPPDGTLDARQPSPLAGSPLQGIGGAQEPIFVQLSDDPGDVPLHCFTLCETADYQDQPNAITAADHLGGGLVAIHLARPITPGASTTIRYEVSQSSVVFTSRPADANADGISSVSDILFLIDMLNGVALPPHGVYSQDMDRSGLFTPPDILRLIDLLNGAEGYDEWMGVSDYGSIPVCP